MHIRGLIPLNWPRQFRLMSTIGNWTADKTFDENTSVKSVCKVCNANTLDKNSMSLVL